MNYLFTFSKTKYILYYNIVYKSEKYILKMIKESPYLKELRQKNASRFTKPDDINPQGNSYIWTNIMEAEILRFKDSRADPRAQDLETALKAEYARRDFKNQVDTLLDFLHIL